MKKKSKLITSAAFAGLLVLGMIIFPPKSLACGGDGLTAEDGSITNCEELPSDYEPSPSEPTEFSEEDYFSSDSKLSSKKETNNSLFLAGNEVSSKDSVVGIGFIAGNLVEALGEYEYGLLAGNSIKVSGIVENDLFAAGNAIEIDEDAYIGRDVFAVGNVVNLSTNLNGNVFVAGNRLVLENITIAGNLSVDFDEIVIKGKSSVFGTFKYNEDANITGLENLSFKEKETFANPSFNLSFGRKLLNKAISLISYLVLAFILIALFPKFVSKLLKNFEAKNIFKDTLLGLGVLFIIPLLSIFIMITIIGLPIGAISLGCWAFLLAFSSSVSSLILGNLLLSKITKKKEVSPFLSVALGAFLIKVLMFVPGLNAFVGLLSIAFGIGYLLANLRTAKR